MIDIDAKGMSRRLIAALGAGEITPATHDDEGTPYPEVNRPLIIDPSALGESGVTDLVYVGRLPEDRRIRILRGIHGGGYCLAVGMYEW